MKTFDTDEAFYADGTVDSNIIVKDADGTIWSGWCSEGGLWYVARARHEGEGLGPESDPWRPIGPIDLDDIPFPIEVFNVCEAFIKRVADEEPDYQYGIDHRRSDIETEDEDDSEFQDEDHAATFFDEMGYSNARIVRRTVGPWEQAERDDDGEIVGWSLLVDWDDIEEVD